MRVGIGTMPLDSGKCPAWLFEKMKRLSRAIVIEIVANFGSEVLLERLADVVWLQSFGTVLGWDWNSSGLGIVTLAALKEGIRGIEQELGIFVCGGKGRTSRKTPEQIKNWTEILGFEREVGEKLVKTSKLVAKIDSSCLQDGFQIYHHNFIFTKKGNWAVVQQGMNTIYQKARRYHWFGKKIKNFLENPHSGIISDIKTNPLNLIAKESFKNKEVILELANNPKSFLSDLKLLTNKRDFLIREKRENLFVEMELNNIEFHWHPVLKEKFDLKRIEKIISKVRVFAPKDFKSLIALEGIGPKTIRALSLVGEIIYGAKPSYQDPARYSFAVGGKDKTPFPIQRDVYDKLIEIMEKGIKKAKISLTEKELAKKRLSSLGKHF